MPLPCDDVCLFSRTSSIRRYCPLATIVSLRQHRLSSYLKYTRANDPISNCQCSHKVQRYLICQLHGEHEVVSSISCATLEPTYRHAHRDALLRYHGQHEYIDQSLPSIPWRVSALKHPRLCQRKTRVAMRGKPRGPSQTCKARVGSWSYFDMSCGLSSAFSAASPRFIGSLLNATASEPTIYTTASRETPVAKAKSALCPRKLSPLAAVYGRGGQPHISIATTLPHAELVSRSVDYTEEVGRSR